MNALIRIAKEHAKEMNVCDELPFDDVYYAKVMREMIIDDSTICLVYDQGGVLIGYSIAYLHTKVWNPTLFAEMAYFYLAAGERNKMMADMLWNETIRKCKEYGAKFFESSVCAWTRDYQGSTDAIERASVYFEHKNGSHCGNIFVHRLEEV
jgi:hypothetical protein